MNSNLDIYASATIRETDDGLKIAYTNNQPGEREGKHIAMNEAYSEQSDVLSISLPVVPMKTLLEAYTQKKINAQSGAKNTDYDQTRNSIRGMIGEDSDSTDNSSDELKDKLNSTEDKQKCRQSVAENAMEICKKLENFH